MTISKCCGAEVPYDIGERFLDEVYEGDKPMKHEVKVGDRFRLGPWEWRVYTRGGTRFSAMGRRSDGEEPIGSMIFLDEEADSLDWIRPEVTFTKEQVEAIKENYTICHSVKINTVNGHLEPEQDVFLDWLSAHTEK